jgi:hypothetical protein
MMFRIGPWIRNFCRDRGHTPKPEGTVPTPPNPVVRAFRQPFDDSPQQAQFMKIHGALLNAPHRQVYVDIVGAPGVGKMSLIKKVLLFVLYALALADLSRLCR